LGGGGGGGDDDIPPELLDWLSGLMEKRAGEKGKRFSGSTTGSEKIQLETLKLIDRLSKQIDGDGEFVSGEGDADIGGAEMKAFRNLRLLKAHIRDKPEPIVKGYIERWSETLTESSDRPWSWADAQKSIRWGGNVTARKAWVGLSATLRLLRARASPSKEEWRAQAQVVQLMKSFEQHALNGGSWVDAWHLSGLEDPEKGREFAGTEEELSVIVAHRKAMSALQAKTGGPGRAPPAATSSAGPPADGGNKTTRAQKRAKAKATAARTGNSTGADAAAAAAAKAAAAALAAKPDHP